MEVNSGIELIEKYFVISESELAQFKDLYPLYETWNAQINLISRKDFDQFYSRHVLHSLTILTFLDFKIGTRFLDIGTGGGFPGIPLAISKPDCHFDMIDGKAKKIKVVNDVIEKLPLKNAKGFHLRAEECKEKYDFILARAVTELPRLLEWSKRLISKKQQNAKPNGLITLKGGDPMDELKKLKRVPYHEIFWLRDIYEEEFFETKYMLYIPI